MSTPQSRHSPLITSLCFGAILFVAPKLAAVEPRREIIVTGAEIAWISSVPLTSGGEATRSTTKENVPLRLPAASGPVLVCVGADERATVCRRMPIEGPFVETFKLDRGRLVEGRCFIGRSPAAGATVSVRFANLEARRPFTIPLASAPDGKSETTTKVDNAGRFRIDHLAPGDYVFEIVTAQGRAEDSDIITVPPLKPRADGTPSPRELALGDIRLAEGVALYVEVRSTDGIAIPAASVTVAQKGDRGIAARSFERKADEKGIAHFDGLDAGLPIRVACSAPGFAQFNGTLATPTPLATCVLQRFGSIEGTVVDSDGAPVAAATVEILGDSGKRVAADADGAFSFTELAVGSFRVRASAPGRGSAIREVTVAEGEDADVGKLELANVAAVRGRVVSSLTGEPIAGAAVTAVDPPGLTTATDAGGMFELDCDETVATTIQVTASGYARARSSVRPTETDTVHAIRLQRPGTLEVTAWDDDGEPCRGCTIVAAGEDDVRSVFANERGLAQFDGLTPGEYRVARERISSTSRQVVVSGGGDTQTGLVTANATTRLELGSPARALRVRVSPSLPADHALRAYGSSRTVTAARLQADGSFSFPRRRGETYDLRVESRTGGVFVGHITPAFSGDTFSAQLGDATVEIRLTSATTAAGYLVNVLAASGSRVAWARTDGSGIARVLYLQPGSYTVALGDQLLGTVIARSGGVDVLTATVN